jgi:hypothetical protein
MVAPVHALCELEPTGILINSVSDAKEGLLRVGFSFGFTSPDKNVKDKSIEGLTSGSHRPIGAELE